MVAMAPFSLKAADKNRLSKKQRAFLAAYCICGNITEAAERGSVARSMHYEWLEKDPAYAEAFKYAGEEAADHLEAEARRRAAEGVRRIRFGRNGKPLIDPNTKKPYVEHEYSDTLLIFLLKGIRPEKYREIVHQQLTGPNGGPIEVRGRLSGMTNEELEAILRDAAGDAKDDPKGGDGDGPAGA